MGIKFNANEVYEIGVQIEKNGKAFYKAASSGSNDESAKNLFSELADWEDQHVQIFLDLKSKLKESDSESTAFDPDNEAIRYLKAVADSHIFVKNKDGAALAKTCKTPLDALQIALDFEKDSVVLYASMQRMVPEKLGKSDIVHMLDEELKHIEIISGKIREFGGV
jgi:rubrerythrin